MASSKSPLMPIESTVYLAVLAMAHNYNLIAPGFLGVMAVGGTVVVADGMTAEQVFSLIERERVTMVPAAPPLVVAWLSAIERPAAAIDALYALHVLPGEDEEETERRNATVLLRGLLDIASEHLGDLVPVDCLDHIEKGNRFMRLVGLQGADKVQFEIWVACFQPRPFF